MTDHAPLTDEELGRLQLRFHNLPYVPRIIAELLTKRAEVEARRAEVELLIEEIDDLHKQLHDLDASRAEVERLTHEIMGYQVDDGYAKGHEHGQASTVAIVLELRAEIERLRAENAELQSLAVEATKKAVRSYLDSPAECRCSCKPCSFCDTAVSADLHGRVCP